MTGRVESVQNAAIERALVGDDPAYLRFAGALEPIRETAPDANPTIPAVLSLYLSTSSDVAVSPPAGPDVPTGPISSPSPTATGAALAVRRFDLTPRRAASLGDVPLAAVERALVNVLDD